MSKPDYIRENMESNDVFIKVMYTDLYNRIKNHEETEAVVEKMKFSDAAGSVVAVGLIALYLAYVVMT